MSILRSVVIVIVTEKSNCSYLRRCFHLNSCMAAVSRVIEPPNKVNFLLDCSISRECERILFLSNLKALHLRLKCNWSALRFTVWIHLLIFRIDSNKACVQFGNHWNDRYAIRSQIACLSNVVDNIIIKSSQELARVLRDLYLFIAIYCHSWYFIVWNIRAHDHDHAIVQRDLY